MKNRLIAGAALDVYEREPEVHPDLLALENVVLAPHLGSATTETRTAMADLAVAATSIAVLTGEPPLTPVPVATVAILARPRSPGRSVERIMRALARRSPASSCRRSRRSPRAGRGSVSDSDRDAAVGAHAGRDDARGVDAAVQGRAHAATMARLPVKQIERLIYPVSFYRNKART